MARPRVQRTEGIVIKRIDFGEADKLLTLYTPFTGKLHAIAKGARRPTSKLGGHVELFTHSQLLLAKGRNLDIVTQSETLHSFISLRGDLHRTGCACYVAEVLDRFTVEHVENAPVFSLLLETLQRLNDGRNPEMALRVFEMQLLGHLGYRPQLHRCASCHELLGPTGNFFSAASGGALCQNCGRESSAARGMAMDVFKVLRFLQSGEYNTASRLRLDRALGQEIETIMRSQITYVLEGELKSVGVLKSLGNEALSNSRQEGTVES